MTPCAHCGRRFIHHQGEPPACFVCQRVAELVEGVARAPHGRVPPHMARNGAGEAA